MADERDPKVSQRYRGLGAEEPSRELDERILAAARRAGHRTGRYRWAAPLAAAAVLVLAVGVALHVERQQPALEEKEVAKQEPAKPAQEALMKEKREAPPQAAPAAPVFAPDPKQAPSREMRARPEARARSDVQARAQPAPAPSSAADAVGPAAAPERAAAPQARARAELAKTESPEKWLERIVELRSRGKHEEADKALAEFRRAYPHYKIPETMREKLEGR
jgi:hypothetical protein